MSCESNESCGCVKRRSMTIKDRLVSDFLFVERRIVALGPYPSHEQPSSYHFLSKVAQSLAAGQCFSQAIAT